MKTRLFLSVLIASMGLTTSATPTLRASRQSQRYDRDSERFAGSWRLVSLDEIDTSCPPCTREWSWLWDVRATHRGCVPKQAFVDHWHGASDLTAGTPPIQLSERNA